MKRKRRAGEVVCDCGAYKFPHREMGGKCDGGGYVDKFFEMNMTGECASCIMRTDNDYQEYRIDCQVLQGLEPTTACPALQERIRYHGIKLYGVNR